MKTNDFKLKSLIIMTSLFLTACGGGGSDNNGGDSNNNDGGTPPSFSSKTINGVAVDFYLSNATVTLDNCDDGAGGKLSAVTNQNGNFEFKTTENCQSSALTITGGTDTVTGLPFTGTLKVKETNLQSFDAEKSLVASPLTTIAAYVTSESELQAILTSLGITSVTAANLGSFDPVKQGTAQEMASVFILQQLITQIEDTLQSTADGSGLPIFSSAEATKLAINSIAVAIKASPANAPLFANGGINTALLTSITSTAAAQAQIAINQKGITADVPSLNEINSVITTVYEAIETVVSNGGNGSSLQDALKGNRVLDTIKEQLKTPTIKAFSLANFDLAALKASSVNSPILLNKALLTNLAFVNFALANAKTVKNESAQIAVKLTATRGSVIQTLNVSLSNLNIKFKADGKIDTVTIPKGTDLDISSSLSEIESTTLTLTKDIILTPDSNGNVSLFDVLDNTQTLKNYYDTYFTKLHLGDQIQVIAVVAPRMLSIDPSLDLHTSSVKVNTSTVTGSTVQSYFKVN